jgi:hypothetical protein
MVEDEGEHTLAAADEEALDATKQEEWRASRESPAHVGVVASLRQRERERTTNDENQTSEKGDWRWHHQFSFVTVRRENGMEGKKAVASRL